MPCQADETTIGREYMLVEYSRPFVRVRPVECGRRLGDLAWPFERVCNPVRQTIGRLLNAVSGPVSVGVPEAAKIDIARASPQSTEGTHHNNKGSNMFHILFAPTPTLWVARGAKHTPPACCWGFPFSFNYQMAISLTLE